MRGATYGFGIPLCLSADAPGIEFCLGSLHDRMEKEMTMAPERRRFGNKAFLAPASTPSALATCTYGTWQQVANMPSDLYGAAAASDGTYAYVGGGYSIST